MRDERENHKKKIKRRKNSSGHILAIKVQSRFFTSSMPEKKKRSNPNKDPKALGKV